MYIYVTKKHKAKTKKKNEVTCLSLPTDVLYRVDMYVN